MSSFDFDKISTGTDIESVSRFENKTLETDRDFLDRIFTSPELDYCFSSSKPAQRLCARFCAKEAAVKALTAFGITDVYYSDIEITKEPSGMPVIKIKKHPEISAKVTLSHTKDYASANVIMYNRN